MKKRVWEITLDNGDKFEFFADNKGEAMDHVVQLESDPNFKELTNYDHPMFTRWALDGDL